MTDSIEFSDIQAIVWRHAPGVAVMANPVAGVIIVDVSPTAFEAILDDLPWFIWARNGRPISGEMSRGRAGR
jgi:hypothetical protein